jgi:hypothetical protein
MARPRIQATDPKKQRRLEKDRERKQRTKERDRLRRLRRLGKLPPEEPAGDGSPALAATSGPPVEAGAAGSASGAPGRATPAQPAAAPAAAALAPHLADNLEELLHARYLAGALQMLLNPRGCGLDADSEREWLDAHPVGEAVVRSLLAVGGADEAFMRWRGARRPSSRT